MHHFVILSIFLEDDRYRIYRLLPVKLFFSGLDLNPWNL